MEKFKTQLLINLLIIGGAFGIATFLCYNGLLHRSVFLLVAWLSYRPAKELYYSYMILKYAPVRVLKKVLPKIGGEIKEIERVDESNFVRFIVQYKELTFLFNMEEPSRIIDIIIPNFTSVKVDDPKMLKMLDALSYVNNLPGPCCGMSEVNDDDNCRNIHCYDRIVLPEFDAKGYLEYVLDNMLKRVANLRECYGYVENTMDKRPYLTHSPRKPIGFKISPDKIEDERSEDVAAQTTQSI